MTIIHNSKGIELIQFDTEQEPVIEEIELTVPNHPSYDKDTETNGRGTKATFNVE